MPSSATAANRDANRELALILHNTLGTSVLYPTAVSLTDSVAQHVAIVDANGDQVTSFGGGTQYTDAGTPPAHPVGGTIEFNNAGAWATVGSANPLPVSGSFSLTNPSTGSAVPATANYIAGNKAGNLTGLLIGSQTTANSLAVALASDQVSIPVAATLAAETTKVIGTVNIATSQTVGLVAGTAVIGKVSIDQTTPGTTNAVDTELPAAATIAADGVTPTVPGLAAYNFIKTPGANTWDRLYSIVNATNTTGTGIVAAGMVAQFDDASPTAITENQFGNVRMSANRNLYNTIRDAAGNERGANVTASNELLVNVNNNVVVTATNLSTNTSQIAGTTTLTGNGTTGAGSQRVTVASDNTPFPIKIDQTTPGTTNAVTDVPATSGGWSTFMATSGDGSTALTNTAQQVKGSAGQLGGWYIYNPNASVAYVIIYNVASASVTVGTTNPQVVLAIPATSAANVEFGKGIAFSTAISIAATTTGGGATAPGTALEANFFYK